MDIHYTDVIMSAIASQITSLTIVHSTVYSDAAQRKHQSSASLAFVWGIHRGPVNSPHKWPVTRKMFPFHDVIMFGYIHVKLWDPSKPFGVRQTSRIRFCVVLKKRPGQVSVTRNPLHFANVNVFGKTRETFLVPCQNVSWCRFVNVS